MKYTLEIEIYDSIQREALVILQHHLRDLFCLGCVCYLNYFDMINDIYAKLADKKKDIDKKITYKDLLVERDKNEKLIIDLLNQVMRQNKKILELEKLEDKV